MNLADISTIIESYLTTNVGQLIYFLLIILVTYYIAKISTKFLDRKFSFDSQKEVRTHHVWLKHSISLLIYLIGIGLAIYSIPSLRTLSVSLFAGAGVLAIIVGFASQQAFANIVSGIFIATFQPFRVDDIVGLKENVFGKVEDINLRHTIIRAYDNKRIIIPNSLMNSEIITNYTIADEKICQFIEVGISYDSDVAKAKKIMQQIVSKHPLCADNRSPEDIISKKPKVVVRMLGFGDGAIKLRAWAWANSPGDAFVMSCEVNEEIKTAFDKAHIEMPFPYRTIVMKKKKRRKR